MPCNSGPYFPPEDPLTKSIREAVSPLTASLERAIERKRGMERHRIAKVVRGLKHNLDHITRLLCGVLKKNPSLLHDKNLATWWKDHKSWDQKRNRKKK